MTSVVMPRCHLCCHALAFKNLAHTRYGLQQIKELELSNPARKAIAYTARLEGHKDFATDASTVRIDAHGSSRFPIKCSPSTSVPQEAR